MEFLVLLFAAIPVAGTYFVIAFAYWLVTAFTAGFTGNQMNLSDFYGSMLWPISLSMMIGQLVRVYIERKKQK